MAYTNVIPLDWYSKSEQKKLRDLDALYQSILDDYIPNYIGLTEKQVDQLHDSLVKRYKQLKKLRKEIGFDT